jgi:hypothetical protein
MNVSIRKLSFQKCKFQSDCNNENIVIERNHKSAVWEWSPSSFVQDSFADSRRCNLLLTTLCSPKDLELAEERDACLINRRRNGKIHVLPRMI